MTEKKTKVRFIRDTRPGEADEIWPEGTELDLPEASVARWLRRGAIEVVETPAPKPNAKNTKKVKNDG